MMRLSDAPCTVTARQGVDKGKDRLDPDKRMNGQLTVTHMQDLQGSAVISEGV